MKNKANNTEVHKVNLLKKKFSHKIRDLVLTLSHKLGDADYNGWSEQMDVFAHNLQNHTHQAKSNNTSNYCPSNNNNITPAPTPAGDPMDLDATSLGGLPTQVRQHPTTTQ